MAEKMFKVYISPSDQTANKYAYGGTNEAVVCRKIADAEEAALLRCKRFLVKNNQTDDMWARVRESDAWGADLHQPLHTNALNATVDGTIIFCWDKSGEGYKASKAIFDKLAPFTPGDAAEYIKVDKTLYEIREAAAPTAYIEADFHSVKDVAKWLIENAVAIGEKIAEGVCDYFGVEYIPPETKKDEPAAKPAIDGVTVTLPILKKGSKGDEVKALQTMLKGLGYSLGIWGPDGDFGAQTDAVVKKYQKKKGLEVDGIVGAATWKSLLGV